MPLILPRTCNQAYQLGKYAIQFIQKGQPSLQVLNKTKLFHTDSVLCGISAISCRTNAPIIFRNQALEEQARVKTKFSSKLFGHSEWVPTTKAILANCSAVRQWDSNGTVFGYEKDPNRQAGEFGHNDFYPVVIGAAHENYSINGKIALKAMILLDQIRGRLCQVFPLKKYKIDHVVHGGIASIATYGSLMNANAQQIEKAIGMYVAHFIPFRAIRAGKQLSDSKGASAALAAEAAVTCMKRSMHGFIGPSDIFRNPQAIFRLFQKSEQNSSPFDIYLESSGSDFAVMSMHFKLGLYEHQSAGALEGVQKILLENNLPQISTIQDIKKINIISYEPAFGIIGDPAKRNPTTRQSADHSMIYIVSTIIRKAYQKKLPTNKTMNQMWKHLMLQPQDYNYKAIRNKKTKQLMQKCTFQHGGQEYDKKYPQGIPTSIQILMKDGTAYDSKLIMFPSGHSRNKECDLQGILQHKFQQLGKIGLNERQLGNFIEKLQSIQKTSSLDLQNIYNCKIYFRSKSIDEEQQH